jgi:hypothetical protein
MLGCSVALIRGEEDHANHQNKPRPDEQRLFGLENRPVHDEMIIQAAAH